MTGSQAQGKTQKHPIAFNWYAPQPVVILISLLLGAFSGWLFRFGSLPFAWIMFLFGFVWILIMGLGLAMWLAWRVRVAKGQWRAALHLGFSSLFPPTTTYLAGVILLTFSIPLTVVTLPEGQALSRPDYITHFAVLYACAAIVGAFAGPLYMQGSPLPPPRRVGADGNPSAVGDDVARDRVSSTLAVATIEVPRSAEDSLPLPIGEVVNIRANDEAAE